MEETIRTFDRNDIMGTLTKGQNYFANLANETKDDKIIPIGNNLTNIIKQFQQSIQQSEKPKKIKTLGHKCLDTFREFTGSAYKFQQKTGSKFYDSKRKAYNEFHTAIAHYMNQNL